MKASWKGTLNLGLMAIPVRLYNATQDIGPVLKQVHLTDLSPIERVPYCRAEQRAVDRTEIGRVVADPSGQLIPLSEDELDRLTADRARAIQIIQFCEPTDIDPLLIQRPYYIIPDRAAGEAFAVLREAMTRTRRAAIARYVMNRRERLGAIFVRAGTLVLEQLRFAAEIRPVAQLPLPNLSSPPTEEVTVATELINHSSRPFYAEDYHNEYARRIAQLVAHKKRGLPLPNYESPISVTQQAENLVKTLRASFDQQPPPRRRTTSRRR